MTGSRRTQTLGPMIVQVPDFSVVFTRGKPLMNFLCSERGVEGRGRGWEAGQRETMPLGTGPRVPLPASGDSEVTPSGAREAFRFCSFCLFLYWAFFFPLKTVQET